MNEKEKESGRDREGEEEKERERSNLGSTYKKYVKFLSIQA